jgi:acyl-CoA reductase-like NAD-dependent aldehyde dehydrogenase
LSDLGRHPFASELAEVNGVVGDCKWNLKNIDRMMKDEHIDTEMLQYTTCAAKTTIRYEPLGVVGVFGAWNYPYNLTMGPLL